MVSYSRVACANVAPMDIPVWVHRYCGLQGSQLDNGDNGDDCVSPPEVCTVPSMTVEASHEDKASTSITALFLHVS